MSRRGPVVRAFAFGLAMALGWSLSATCIEAAMATPTAQMACCKNGHHHCTHAGSPADCCKLEPQASQFTVSKITLPPQSPTFVQMVGTDPNTLQPAWRSHPLTLAWSPPGAKPPAFLLFSNLRI